MQRLSTRLGRAPPPRFHMLDGDLADPHALQMLEDTVRLPPSHLIGLTRRFNRFK